VLSFPNARPDRFALGVQVDPRRLMKATSALASMVASQPVVLARITPFYLDLAPDHRVYYPIYAKCIELALPLTINTGSRARRRPLSARTRSISTASASTSPSWCW